MLMTDQRSVEREVLQQRHTVNTVNRNEISQKGLEIVLKVLLNEHLDRRIQR